MAKIIFGNFVTEARGKIAGNVYSQNANGAFVRKRVKGTNPKTPSQLDQRSAFSVLSSAWRALTNPQREAWAAAKDDYPYTDSLGQRKTYTGQQLYMHLNRALQAIGSSTLSTPPQPVSAPTIAVSSVAVDSTSFDITFSQNSMPTGFRMQVFASGTTSAGIMRPSQSRFRLVSTLSSLTAGVGDALAGYTAKFGTPVASTVVWVQVIIVSTTTGQQFDLGKQAVVVQ